MASYYCPRTHQRTTEPCACTSADRVRTIRVPVGTLVSFARNLTHTSFKKVIRG